MNIEEFLSLCRQTIQEYQPLIDWCLSDLGAAQRVYVGTFPRLPAKVESGPVIVIESGTYILEEATPGKLFSPGFAAFFQKEGSQDRELDGVIAREHIFRLCLEALQQLNMQILDITAEPEYMLEYPNFAIYWSMTFRLEPSETLEAIEGGGWS